MRIPSLAVLLSALLLSLNPGTALAGDGVLEINQTCAVQTGCFAGDTAGLPVTIPTSGSYRLTSNLSIPDPNTDGIVLSTSSVSIDLAGFEIAGPLVCDGIPTVCAPASGTGSGVERTSTLNRGLSVRHGSITGMGRYGVLLGDQAEVTNLRVRSNGLLGISVGLGSTVSGNTAYQNGNHGIFASFGSTVSGNTAYRNQGDGISASNGSTVSGNTAYQNGNDGINCGSGCTIIGNTAYNNGDATSPDLNDGIACGDGCILRANNVRANSGYGLNLFTDSAYSENVVTSNTTGTVTGLGSANDRGGNYCAGTGTVSAFCP